MKILYRTVTILQILFLTAAYEIQSFSEKTMGMMRYVEYINHKWEELYPIHTLQSIIILILVIISFIIFLQFIKNRKRCTLPVRMSLPMVIALAVIMLIYMIFTLSFSTRNYRSYYFISFALAVITLIQDIKIFVYIKYKS